MKFTFFLILISLSTSFAIEKLGIWQPVPGTQNVKTKYFAVEGSEFDDEKSISVKSIKLFKENFKGPIYDFKGTVNSKTGEIRGGWEGSFQHYDQFSYTIAFGSQKLRTHYKFFDNQFGRSKIGDRQSVDEDFIALAKVKYLVLVVPENTDNIFCAIEFNTVIEKELAIEDFLSDYNHCLTNSYPGTRLILLED